MLARGTIAQKKNRRFARAGAFVARDRQLLTESFVSHAGGGLGLLLRVVDHGLVAAAIAGCSGASRDRVDGNVVLFTVLLSLFATFLFALLRRERVQTSLKQVLQDTVPIHRRRSSTRVLSSGDGRVFDGGAAVDRGHSRNPLHHEPGKHSPGLNPDTVRYDATRTARNKYPARAKSDLLSDPSSSGPPLFRASMGCAGGRRPL